MKTIFVFFAVICGLTVANIIPIPKRGGVYSDIAVNGLRRYGESFVPPEDVELIADRCAKGPGYWCTNITTAKECGAVRTCIQVVWEHMTVEPDTDSVCDICKQMVQEARDQLESNETQEELKEVFEGSCRLIPLKPVANECVKLADDFVPELVETLASQMNPQVVCAVAGLCNNPHIDNMIANGVDLIHNTPPNKKAEQCQGCYSVVKTMRTSFESKSRDEVLQGFLHACGKLSSYSDACTNIIITYFNDIYNHLKRNLKPDQVCLLSGMCSEMFHTHATTPNVEITPKGNVGVLPVGKGDDLPCKFCEQLVTHLRDLLITNTTKLEFKKILEGICKQFPGEKDQCLATVDQYYELIYDFLVSELNANEICYLLNLCGDNSTKSKEFGPTWALLSSATKEKLEGSSLNVPYNRPAIKKGLWPKSGEADDMKSAESSSVLLNPETVQLPIERMMPPTLQVGGNKELCVFCEYFLHYVQEVITSPTTEEKIKEIVDKGCDVLPKSVGPQCRIFVDTYGDALVAILAQEIDPSQVCTLLQICTSSKDIDKMIYKTVDDKPTCPLCLLAVKELESAVIDKKTEANIKKALDNLCSHLPKSLSGECTDFVNTYADELIEMLMADFTPQEVCTYLKLCSDDKPEKDNKFGGPVIDIDIGGIIETNEIPDSTYNGKPMTPINKPKAGPLCVLCKIVMAQIDKELKDKRNEDEIKNVVHGVCNRLPKSISKECNDFINQYGDTVIQLLVAVMQPDDICPYIELCSKSPSPVEVIVENVDTEISDCAYCQELVVTAQERLKNPRLGYQLEGIMSSICTDRPQEPKEKCTRVLNVYGMRLRSLFTTKADSSAICVKAGACSSLGGQVQFMADEPKLVGDNKCTWGPGHWCKSLEAATQCNAQEYCKEKHWGGKSAP